MNKKLINLAVAAALVAPAAAMAEATLYGKLHVSIDYADVTNAIPPVFYTPNGDPAGTIEGIQQIYLGADGRAILAGGQDFTGWGVSRGNSYIPGASRANRIGVKGSEDLGGGLKAIYQVEFGVNLSDTNDNVVSNSDSITYRNSFVGLAGGWGTFLVGRHDTPHKISTGKLDLFADTMADYNGTVGFQDIRADNAIAYISPSFSGFQLAGAVIAPGGATAGFGESTETDSIAEAWSIAAIYKNGPFYASAAYELLGADHFMTQATADAGSSACILPDGTPAPGCAYVDDDFKKYRFGLGILDWNGFTLTGIYENQDDIPAGQTRTPFAYMNPDGTLNAIVGVQDGTLSQNLYQVQAAYAFGNNTIKAMYGWMDRDDEKALVRTRESLSIGNLRRDLSGDANTWAIAFDHNFSKRTKAYVLYTSVDDDRKDNPNAASADWDGFSLGMIHSF
jgi:predicted porin